MIERRTLPRGGTVELHERRKRSGDWLFLVTTQRDADGRGSITSETTGFPTIELAREAMAALRDGRAHAELRGRLSIGEPTPGGPPDVEQVWGPGVHTMPS